MLHSSVMAFLLTAIHHLTYELSLTPSQGLRVGLGRCHNVFQEAPLMSTSLCWPAQVRGPFSHGKHDHQTGECPSGKHLQHWIYCNATTKQANGKKRIIISNNSSKCSLYLFTCWCFNNHTSCLQRYHINKVPH